MMRHPVPIIQVSYLLALWLSTSHTSLCYLKYKIKLLSALVLLWGRNEIIDIKPPVHKAAHSTCSVNSCYKNCVASPLWLTYVNHTRRGWQSHLINDESEVQNAGTALARARRRARRRPDWPAPLPAPHAFPSAASLALENHGTGGLHGSVFVFRILFSHFPPNILPVLSRLMW